MSETNKESECEDSDCDLKNLVQELDEDEKIEGKTNKNLANILNKVQKSPKSFEKFKTETKESNKKDK